MTINRNKSYFVSMNERKAEWKGGKKNQYLRMRSGLMDKSRKDLHKISHVE